MTPVTSSPAATLTARSFLFGSRAEAVDGFTRVLADHDVVSRSGAALGRLTSAAHRLLYERLANVAADLADIDVAAVVAGGWRTYAALTDAAWRTRDRPGTEELVDLASHRIHSIHRPQVDVLLDDVPVGSVDFELELDIVVRALAATVSEGRLTAVEGGRCTLRGRLSCLDVPVAAREAEADLGAVLELGEGFPLVPPRGDVPP